MMILNLGGLTLKSYIKYNKLFTFCMADEIVIFNKNIHYNTRINITQWFNNEHYEKV
ncbi:MAG: hypothetical protein K0R54_193 [Clostridiaceae bacterium]|jgi:hypothetical protein|nr:hypothetical protein [Clostridiaceae bacterium]